MKLLVKFPTRGRRRKFEQVLDIYLRTSSNNTTFLVSLDSDDQAMMGIEQGRKEENIIWVRGMSEGKIHACNRDIERVEEWDVLVLASDDMIPQKKDWDLRIVQEMRGNFPDTDGVLHFNDGYTGETLNTMCILGRKYYDRFGYIYHSDYKSLWSDNEFMEVSRKLNRAKYFDEVLFKHEHPANNREIRNDALYFRNDRLYEYDKQVFNRRKAMNFDL